MKLRVLTRLLHKLQWLSPILLEDVRKSTDLQYQLSLADTSLVSTFSEFDYSYVIADSADIKLSTNIHSGELKYIRFVPKAWWNALLMHIILKAFPRHVEDLFVLIRPDIPSSDKLLFLRNGTPVIPYTIDKDAHEVRVETLYGTRTCDLNGEDSRSHNFDVYEIKYLDLWNHFYHK